MNMLIADSGSTKTDWIFISQEGSPLRLRSVGLNPYFKSREEILDVIRDIRAKLNGSGPDGIWFYGSGCADEGNQELLRGIFSELFGDIKCQVSSDLLGAARALFGNKKGIASILGTGSNTGYYDGKEIAEQVPSLGFILGDEGSGNYFGKQIIRDYYSKRLPDEIKRHMETEYNLSLDYTLDRLYKQEGANAYVASFSKILVHFSDHEYVRKLIRSGLNEYVKRQLDYLRDAGSSKVGLVGSIAYIHQDILKEVLGNAGYTLENVIQSPIDSLADYHRYKHLKEEKS